MKKITFTLLFFALISCKQKEPSKSDYLQRAIKSDDYKVVSTNFKRVQDSLDMRKKRHIDTTVIIFEFSNIAGSSIHAKTMGQVIKAMSDMNKDNSFLKTVQYYIADSLAKDHRDSVKDQH